jgi:ornithine cyclodeaminase/alanine dehydrogenase-like protein (mu-crystallin family)
MHVERRPGRHAVGAGPETPLMSFRWFFVPMKTPLLYLCADDVRQALPMSDAIEAMREAFARLCSGQVTLPPRQRLAAPGEHGVALVMSCHDAVQKLFALKFITLFDENRQRGLPLIQSLVLLTDGTTGEPLAVMDGGALTAIRTGAASGVATDLLARPDAAVAAVFGAGVQARTQLEAVCSVRSIRRAYVYDPDPGAAERFSAEMTRQLGLPVQRAATPAAALADADVVCTATTSATAVFDDHDLKPGAHINAVGSYRPDVTEIPAATVCRARVVVDHRASALEEAGDLLGPLRQGMISPSHVHTELGEVRLGRSPGRGCAEEITLFKSVGVAIEDLCAGARAVENARRLGLGMAMQRPPLNLSEM